MARPHLNQNLSCPGSRSPNGFWPNPTKEGFHKNETHPWEVPRKRKPRGSKKEFIYDLFTENIVYNNSETIITKNRFGPLDQDKLKEATSGPKGRVLLNPPRKKMGGSLPKKNTRGGDKNSIGEGDLFHFLRLK